ncbi:MAG: hypothetical protein AB7E95_04515 [Kiritimatiellales bacterium]
MNGTHHTHPPRKSNLSRHWNRFFQGLEKIRRQALCGFQCLENPGPLSVC